MRRQKKIILTDTLKYMDRVLKTSLKYIVEKKNYPKNFFLKYIRNSFFSAESKKNQIKLRITVRPKHYKYFVCHSLSFWSSHFFLSLFGALIVSLLILLTFFSLFSVLFYHFVRLSFGSSLSFWFFSFFWCSFMEILWKVLIQ